jgi:hypothetical protein
MFNQLNLFIIFIITPYIICISYYIYSSFKLISVIKTQHTTFKITYYKKKINEIVFFTPILNITTSFYILIRILLFFSFKLRKIIKKIILNRILKKHKIKDIDPYNEEDWSDLINNKFLKLLIL